MILPYILVVIMKTYRSEAIVLRSIKLGESDKIITLFTKEFGIKRAVARGIRKTTSKFGARLEPFNCVDVQLYQGRSLDTITQVEIIHPFSKFISQRFEVFSAAGMVNELCEKLLEESVKFLSLYALTKGALFSLVHKDYRPIFISASFCLRALAVSGWAVSCFACANCGEPGFHEYFNVRYGGAMCNECREAGCVKISVESMRVLSFLLSGDWVSLRDVDEVVVGQVCGVVNAYTQWHLDRPLKATSFQGIL